MSRSSKWSVSFTLPHQNPEWYIGYHAEYPEVNENAFKCIKQSKTVQLYRDIFLSSLPSQKMVDQFSVFPHVSMCLVHFVSAYTLGVLAVLQHAVLLFASALLGTIAKLQRATIRFVISIFRFVRLPA